jgi:aspartate aminotransferase-like enzyme
MLPYTALPFYPGPVSLHPAVADALGRDYGPSRSDPDFRALYAATCRNLRQLAGTSQEIILPTGEAMLGLWGMLKSVLRPGDAVVSVVTGVFGDGLGDMASALGCKVEKVSLPYDQTVTPQALERTDEAIRRLKPVLITAVHCETPSGTLNPLDELGGLKRDRGVPLFAVDAVASWGGVPMRSDDWRIDLLLGGSQKCLSCPPDMTMAAVSGAAWERIAAVRYQGYDAFLPFHGAGEDPALFPYTPNRPGIAALHASTLALLEEGLPAVFARHEQVAAQCRKGLRAAGFALWPAQDAVPSPTVTAARVPARLVWSEWQAELARQGLVLGGSLGPLSGKVFRLGHMGSQADAGRMAEALKILERFAA